MFSTLLLTTAENHVVKKDNNYTAEILVYEVSLNADANAKMQKEIRNKSKQINKAMKYKTVTIEHLYENFPRVSLLLVSIYEDRLIEALLRIDKKNLFDPDNTITI